MGGTADLLSGVLDVGLAAGLKEKLLSVPFFEIQVLS